jgi:hypothetical protein
VTVQIFKVPALRNGIAVSSVGSCVEGGAFLLDFTKPLKFVRGNKWLPFSTAISVPVIHQSETYAAGYTVAVHRWTPEWRAIKGLWKLVETGRFQPQHKPSGPYSGLKIIADFATQFPEFSQSPK